MESVARGGFCLGTGFDCAVGFVFSGDEYSSSVAKHPLHFAINDMQIAEDLQLIIGHMIMQWLCDGANSDK